MLFRCAAGDTNDAQSLGLWKIAVNACYLGLADPAAPWLQGSRVRCFCVMEGSLPFGGFQPLAAFVEDFPDPFLALFHPAVFVNHGVARPLGGVAPADRFPVGREHCVVEGLEHALHLLPHEIQHDPRLGAAAQLNERFENGTVESGVGGDFSFLLFAEEPFAHDLLNGGAGGIPEVFDSIPLGDEAFDPLLECEQTPRGLDDGGGGIVVAALHGRRALAADVRLFLGERVAEEAKGGGFVVWVGRVHGSSEAESRGGWRFFTARSETGPYPLKRDIRRSHVRGCCYGKFDEGCYSRSFVCS